MIRTLVAGDRSWLESMAADFFQELSWNAPGLFAPEAARIHADLYLAGGENVISLVITSAGDANENVKADSGTEPCSVLLARVLQRPARNPARVLTVDIAYTPPEFRGRGWMSELLEALSADAAKRNITRLELGTPVNGPARAYWTKRGFVEEFIQMSRGF